MILKILFFFVLDLVCLAIEWWKWSIFGNVAVVVAGFLWCLTAGVKEWAVFGLIAGGVSLGLTVLAACIRAAVTAWRSRNERIRLLGIHG
jgi:hypothetical protein